MKRLADFRKQVIEGWTVQRIAVVLIVVGAVGFVVGAVNKYCVASCSWMWPTPLWLNGLISDFYANVSVDCLSIAFAILVIDRLNERRAEEELKARFLRELGSPDNGIALQAFKELDVRGWIEDGSLRSIWLPHADLSRVDLGMVNDKHKIDLSGAHFPFAILKNAIFASANLEEVNFHKADLRFTNFAGANLYRAEFDEANLYGAIFSDANLYEATGLTDQQLVTACWLLGMTMPDGNRYDGRYSLSWEQLMFEVNNATSPEERASLFGVSIEAYRAGQEWARENLARVRREAGLDPATGLPVEPTNGTEPQPADAPALPTPRRNGHKASMVSHRVR